jgi:solute carrier family 25 carnitine/acylcarnitine transporter 20/29
VAEIGAQAEQLPLPQLMLAGSVAGVAGWLATFPFDVVKTRMQVAATARVRAGHSDSSMSGPDFWRTVIISYQAEGWRVFFRGLAPTLLR